MTTTITREEKRVGKVRADQLGPRRSIGRRLLTRAPRWGAYILLWAFVLIIIYPLFWMVTASLKTNPEMFSQAWALPKQLQWSNWAQAWQLGVGQADHIRRCR